MTCKESITWLECLKTAIGQHQYRNLWNFVQPLAEIIELLQSDRLNDGSDIGEKVFHTKEETEAKLKELNDEREKRKLPNLP